MTSAIVASVTAYLLMGVCAVWLLRKQGGNRRLRGVIVLVGLMPVVEGIGLLKEKSLADLVVGGMCLGAFYLLDEESRDRKRTDMRLRLVEQETMFGKPHVVRRCFGREGCAVLSYKDARQSLQKPGSFAATN